jgi:hypothetical protein
VGEARRDVKGEVLVFSGAVLMQVGLVITGIVAASMSGVGAENAVVVV